MRHFTSILLFFCLFHFKSTGQVLELDSNFSYKNLGKQLTYMEDKSGKLSLSQVRAMEKALLFKPGKEEILNLGNTKSAFWIKLTYISGSTGRNYLILDVPNIENIDCYSILSTGKISHLNAGAIKPADRGVIVANNFIFELPDQGIRKETTEIFLRVKTNNILMVPIKLATSENFIPGSTQRDTLEILYIGVLITLFLFNIFLYISIKDSLYLYYGLYVFSLAIYVVVYLRGYGYLLGQHLRILINLYPHVFLSVAVAASILFSKKFLNLPLIFPKIDKICNFLIVCCGVMFISSASGFKGLSASLAQYISIVASVVLWISGVVSFKKGHQPAKFYIMAWTFITFTVIAVALSLQGIVTYHDYTFEFVPVGSTIELLLLSFALGDRYKTIIQNEQKARDENLLLVKNQNQLLEKQVEDRTLKLSETILKLEDSNAVKNKLFSIIAHDLRSPFNSLISIFSLKDMDLLTFDELKLLLNENQKNIETIHNTLNNLLYWAKSQMEEVTTQHTHFDLKHLVENLMLVYQPLIEKKGILSRLQVEGDTMVYADENQIQLVLRNLIDNAIKFTSHGRTILIALTGRNNGLEVSLSNTITDPAPFNLKNIMNSPTLQTTYGTNMEKGVGLGLHLCKEYLRSNGSELKAKVDGDMVTFYFELKH